MRLDPSNIIPNSQSASEQWISWHKNLKRWFSKKEANDYFVRFWNQRAGQSSIADTHALRSYMQSQGVDMDTDWGGAFTDSTMKVVDWIGSGLNWTRAIIIGSTILGGAIVGYYFYVQIKKGKTVKDGAVAIANARSGGAFKALSKGGKIKALTV